MSWDNRIKGEATVKAAELQANPKNWRTHPEFQREVMEGVLDEVGWVQRVIVNQTTGLIIDGHLRVEQAEARGEDVPVVYVELTEEEEGKVLATLDPLGGLAGTDQLLLDNLIDMVETESDAITELLEQLRSEEIEPEPDGDPNDAPEPEEEAISQPGDVWILGDHRVMCGDSTMIDHAESLMNGESAALLHADPPYGMGKQKDGVENDNLYREKLDAFQMEWWTTFRTFLEDNASAYIWGNAPDLWRLWYSGGLEASEQLAYRNLIVWDKKNIAGMCSPESRSFSVVTEYCLFFMLGRQFFGNVNTEDFFEGYESIRSYLEGEAKRMEWGAKNIIDLCGVQMYSHWFTKSQWTLIPEKHYTTLQEVANGKAFKRPYAEIKIERDQAKSGGGHLDIKKTFDETRAFFDDTHDIMSDVWDFSRVTGDERHGHATPKPVEMMERVMRSSIPKDGLCIEPFGGSGSTLMGAEKAGRRCYCMELQGNYVDVIIKRWQTYTGKTATLESTGETFAELEAERGE